MDPYEMKKTLFSSVAFLGLTAGAVAADLPSRTLRLRCAPAVPVFTWTGFYVGVNAGYGWNNNDHAVVVRPTSAVTGEDDGGFVGGAQAGYNSRWAFVVGVETDLQYADIGGPGVFTVNGVNFYTTTATTTSAPSAPLSASRSTALWCTPPAVSLTATWHLRRRLHGGWTVGGGVETPSPTT